MSVLASRKADRIFSLLPLLFLGGRGWGENSDLMSFVEVSAIIRERARCVQFFSPGSGCSDLRRGPPPIVFLAALQINTKRTNPF